MTKSNKIYILLFLLFIFISLSSSVSAVFDSLYWDKYYDVEVVKNSQVERLENLCLSDNRVISGDYYYLVTYNVGDGCYNAVLIPKDYVNIDTAYCTRQDFNPNNYWQGRLFFTSTKPNKNDFITLSGNNAILPNDDYVDNNGNWSAKISIKYDDTEQKYTIPFATNIPINCSLKYSETEQKVFMYAPTLLNRAIQGEELEKVMTEILQILPTILVVMVSYLGLRKALSMLSTLLHQS